MTKRVGEADPEELRQCRYCSERKTLREFTITRGRYDWKCRRCSNRQVASYRKAKPEQYNQYGRRWRYGITQAEYEAIIASGLCAICGDSGEQIDHDHATGKVRGYLCKHCNRGLGHFRDSPERLEAAILYLRNANV